MEVVKGDAVVDAVAAEPIYRADVAALRAGKQLLLLRNTLGQRWTNAGAIDPEYAGWLRQLAAAPAVGAADPRNAWPVTAQPPSGTTDAAWLQRVALAAPYLEDREPLAAEIAHGEVARAPYAAMRSLKSKLDAGTIAQWIDDPKLAARRATYTLLLGVAGGPDDAARLEQRIETARTSHDATNLSALLAADLELRGAARVRWIEQMYLGDRSRTLLEIEAALLALGVHGGANAAVSRERVVQAYRLFMRERKPMAGFVAQELADWQIWDATGEYVALLKSDAVKDPASHFLIVGYLRRSPQAAAKAALRSLDRQPR
jgi:hypothetical protein